VQKHLEFVVTQAAQRRVDNGKSSDSSIASEITSSRAIATNPDAINNIIITATSTGSTLTILPSDKPNLNTASTSINNNINDKRTESFIYVEEECYSNTDDDFLTLEDYASLALHILEFIHHQP